MQNNYYDPKLDPDYREPYIDIDEQREDYRYIHGGFRGNDTRFSFFFPKKEDYKGRFFQFMSPIEGSENASIGRQGAEDKIGFAVSHGAYFVETNMGVASGIHRGDGSVIYKASAASAEYSREVAKKMYGEHRPYGYIYGGSGGAFKTTSCFEHTRTWDGAIPYIHGSPMAIPSVFSVRAHAKRVLRHAFPKIVDALEPGGSGNPYEGLSAEERQTLFEVTRMGFPLRSWFYYKDLDDGALPVVAAGTLGRDMAYFKDFWEKPGYLGADPHSSVHGDRIVCDCTVRSVHIPGRRSQEEIAAEREQMTGADNAWKREQSDYGAEGETYLCIDGAPQGDVYAYGTKVTFTSGAAKGLSATAGRIEGDRLILSPMFGTEHTFEMLPSVREGDTLHLDNSDYLAAQTYYRHQIPESREYIGWEQFRTAKGTPIYPVREYLAGPVIASGSCGGLQTGRFAGKMIVVAATMDESAFPWQADWYRKKVAENLGKKADENYRLYFFDHCFHDDRATTVDDLHLVPYLGGLHQALLDLSDWVERGVEPRKTSGYTIEDGQIVLAASAKERGGMQPIVCVKSGDGKKIVTSIGKEVGFDAEIELPDGTGSVTRVEWNFEGEQDYPVQTDFTQNRNIAKAHAKHIFSRVGTYFVTVRVSIQREGTDDVYTQIYNLDRMRVEVKGNAENQ